MEGPSSIQSGLLGFPNEGENVRYAFVGFGDGYVVGIASQDEQSRTWNLRLIA
jgi:hypothetical protein